VLSDPPPLAPKITYQKHADTLPEFMAMLPGTRPEDYPDGEAAAAEWVTLTTHNGTHLDAPWHFTPPRMPRMVARGRPSPSMKCRWSGASSRREAGLPHFADGYVATAADVEAELRRIGHALQPLDIVVVNTRAGAAMASAIISVPAAAWAMKPPCTCWNAACA
jgi:hypothetical protein